MKALSTLLLSTLFLMSSALADKENNDKGPVHHVDAKQAAALVADKKKKVVVLDIRTPDEFKAGHLENAKNIDFFEDDFKAEVEKLDKDKTYLVHCRSGGRSTKSLEVFKKLGFKTIYHLDGGFLAWEEAGKKVVK
jgi:rhodanese-related sulfurtransferase